MNTYLFFGLVDSSVSINSPYVKVDIGSFSDDKNGYFYTSEVTASTFRSAYSYLTSYFSNYNYSINPIYTVINSSGKISVRKMRKSYDY